ncbi:unnamed protein product [Cladocopium goreaui]|uniref:Uncharacterized protein n=1 Tax=Cladocopium goreaui TaxID=2562237 RepID=A0A9P1FJM3_9DINO|nr:unnamed protein product [Cladocopium goreaui]
MEWSGRGETRDGSLVQESLSLRDRVAQNPVPYQACALALILLGLVCLSFGMHDSGLMPALEQRPEQGFCCWRDHPIPFYAGDPCECPAEHRGDYPCPPQGCSQGPDTWQRGPGTPTNTKEFCTSNIGAGSWCPSDRKAFPVNEASTSFCCWRDHPVPGYWGDPCNCPAEHRGDYTCPQDGCTDSTGAKWQRGSKAPFANEENYCRSMSNIAAWCPG